MNAVSQRGGSECPQHCSEKNKSQAHLRDCTDRRGSHGGDKFSLLPLTCSQGLIQLKISFMFFFFSFQSFLLQHKILITWIIVHSLSVNCSAVEHFTGPQLKPGRWKQDGDGRGMGERGEGTLMLFDCHWTVKRRWDPHHVSLPQQRQPPSQRLESLRLFLIITIHVNNFCMCLCYPALPALSGIVAGTELILNCIWHYIKCYWTPPSS